MIRYYMTMRDDGFFFWHDERLWVNLVTNELKCKTHIQIVNK